MLSRKYSSKNFSPELYNNSSSLTKLSHIPNDCFKTDHTWRIQATCIKMQIICNSNWYNFRFGTAMKWTSCVLNCWNLAVLKLHEIFCCVTYQPSVCSGLVASWVYINFLLLALTGLIYLYVRNHHWESIDTSFSRWILESLVIMIEIALEIEVII